MRSSQYSRSDHYDEQRLREEVIYLHSLWHQGPPPDPDLTIPNPRPSYSIVPHVPNLSYNLHYPLHPVQTPNLNSVSNYPLHFQQPLHRDLLSNHPLYSQEATRPKPFTNYSLQPTTPTAFKKESTTISATVPKKSRCRGNKKNKMPRSDPQPDSGLKWPCPKPQELDLEISGWASPKPALAPATQPLSTEDLDRFASIQMQHRAIESCRDFLNKRVCSVSDKDEDDNEETSEEESKENEEFGFFFKMFVEDCELRTFYEKNHETGDLCCLVCGGIGKKVWRRFKGCVGLVQHAATISKTKRKRAHRAFGQVVCKVLGWDIDRFPTIVLKDEPLGRSLAKPSEPQGEPEGKADDNKANPDVIKGDAASVDGNSGENAVSVNASGGSGENAAVVEENGGENTVFASDKSGENAVPVDESTGENLVCVSGDNRDVIDKETCDVQPSSC